MKREVVFGIIGDSHSAPPARKTNPMHWDYLGDARLEATVEEFNRIKPDLVLHMGDVASSWPFRPGNSEGLERGISIMRNLKMPFYITPGNHDVGNKPSGHGGGKTTELSSESLAEYRRIAGDDYYSFEKEGCVFISYNCYLFGSGLPDEDKQWQWLERTLSESEGKRIICFAHCPPYIVRPDEPGPGNYDACDEPYRSQFVDLINKHKVEIVFTGHTHHPFFNMLGSVPHVVVGSTAFARIFCGPWPEHPDGEAFDPAKAGYCLARLLPDGGRRLAWITLEVPAKSDSSRQIVLPAAVSDNGTATGFGVERHDWLAHRADRHHKPSYDAWPLQWILSWGVETVDVVWPYAPSALERDLVRFLNAYGVHVNAVIPGKYARGLEAGIENVVNGAHDCGIHSWLLNMQGVPEKALLPLWRRLVKANRGQAPALGIADLPLDAANGPDIAVLFKDCTDAGARLHIRLEGIRPAFLWENQNTPGFSRYLNADDALKFDASLSKRVTGIREACGTNVDIAASVGSNEEYLARGREFFFPGREQAETRVLWLSACACVRNGVKLVFTPVVNNRTGLLDGYRNPRTTSWVFWVITSFLRRGIMPGEIEGNAEGWHCDFFRSKEFIGRFATSAAYMEYAKLPKKWSHIDALTALAASDIPDGPALATADINLIH
ncbi:MAG: metallophosphoesterase [Lentisphaerae bacterium]|nr:metallophosphoesterase [Lentisphaerota bacterium]